MGKRKPLIILGIAAVVALAASALIYNWLQQKEAQAKAVPKIETQTVSVAVVPLPWGTVLTKEMIKPASFIKASLPQGVFPDPAALAGRVVIYPLTANELILESKLAPQNIKTGGVAAVINPKKRAVAVKVDKVIGVAGFIHPGNRVDVLVTVAPDRNLPPVTKTVLENVLVLATGGEVDRKGKEDKAVTTDVITLEVTPEEAEKLALASTEGKLQMALRNFNDTEPVYTRGTTLPVLMLSYTPKNPVPERGQKKVRRIVRAKPPAKAPPPAPPAIIRVEAPAPAPVAAPPPVPKPAPFVVELIKGSTRHEMKLERGE